MTATAVRHPLAFGDLPGAADLLGGGGARRVADFLEGRGLDPRRVEPAQAHYRPDRWLAVCYRIAAVDRTSGRPLASTVTAECRAGEPLALWAFPDDPSLPGLRAAADATAVRPRLRPRPALLEVEPLRYRPRRRAVLRYRLSGLEGIESIEGGEGWRILFGKVLPPKRAQRLSALAGSLHPAGLRLALPVGRLAPGAVILPSLPGTSLRDLLLAGRALPSPDRLARLPRELHQLCLSGSGVDGIGAGRRRVDPATALGAAQAVGRLLPEAGCAAARVAEAVIASAEEEDPVEEWIVHGDLYENQIVVDGRRFGLLDLDDLGPGDPLLDAANFSAHLLVLGASAASAGAGILRYRDELRTAFCRRLDADPAALAWREAYCLLRLTSGPFRVLHPEWPRRMADRLRLAARALRR